MDQEYVADIPGFSRYVVSSHGEIYNRRFKRLMRQTVTRNPGYDREFLKISLIDDDDVRRTLTVAPLVARAFVRPPSYLCTEVIHLDGNTRNVWAYNLAWRAPRTAYMFARQETLPKKAPWFNLAVRNQQTGVVYANIIECGRKEGLVFQDIWESVNSNLFPGYQDQRMVPPYGHTYEIVRKSNR